MTSVVTRDYYSFVREKACPDLFLEKARIEDSGCWIWTANVHKDGYGKVKIGGRYGKTLSAHRVSWMLFRGCIPEGLYVLHSCDVRECVNPQHLFLGSAQDNMTDMIRKGRGPDYTKLRKISDEQAEAMQRMHASGCFTYQGVADAFDISNAQAWRICNGTRG